MSRTLVLLLVAAAVVAVPSAHASEQRPTLADLANEVICPTCHTTIDQSSSPIALRMKAFIRERIAAGDTKSEIKDKLVAQFGESVLAAPPKSGFNLLAWLLPLVGAVVGAAVLAMLARRWRQRKARVLGAGAVLQRQVLAHTGPRPPGGRGARPLRPLVEAKILPVFLAGMVSFVTPCVLPLVPGYLSVVSGTQPGVSGRRVVAASLPFVLGFTLVFVALGAAVGAVGGLTQTSKQVAGIVLVVFGFAFLGLLPFPLLERLVAPELVQGASRRGSRILLGGAFAVCAAPCVGAFLAPALALAGSRGTVAQGSLLLFVYSLGLAVPFVAVGAGLTWATQASRWLRDRYRILQAVGGMILVAFGLLLFFGRDWWLNVALNRLLNFLGA